MVLFIATGSLPRAITRSDDTEAAALRARLEAIVKEVEDAESQAAAARRCVYAAALEQTTIAARQRVPSLSSSSSCLVAASQLVPTTSSTYEDMVIVGLHLQMAAVLTVH
jgi:hypothetical protein